MTRKSDFYVLLLLAKVNTHTHTHTHTQYLPVYLFFVLCN